MKTSSSRLAEESRTSVCFTEPSARGDRRRFAPPFAVLILALAGCKSSSPSPFVWPRVVERVLDGQTHEPIEGVKIRRLIPDQEPNVINNAKGGQAIASVPAVRAAADGTFVLVSQRGLTPFNKSGWQDWSQFGEVNVGVENAGISRTVKNNYDDTKHGAVGVQFRRCGKWLLTSGMAYDSPAVSDANRTITVPMGEAWRFGLGAQYQISQSVNVGAAFTFLCTRDMSADQGAGNPLRDRVSGAYGSAWFSFATLDRIWKF